MYARIPQMRSTRSCLPVRCLLAAAALAVTMTAGCFAPPVFASCQVVTVKTITGDPVPNLAARISYVAAPSNGATVAREGLAERLSDLLIYDSGAGAACFQN